MTEVLLEGLLYVLYVVGFVIFLPNIFCGA